MRDRVLVVIGTALLLATPLVWLLSRPPADVGILPAPSPTGGTREPAPIAPPTGGPAAAATSIAAPSVVTRSGRLADRPRPATAEPERIRIAALSLDAPVTPVGVETSGALEVPSEVSTVGWYRHGPAPGERGSAVLAGHVDSRTQGRGAFFELARLAPGDRIEIAGPDGTQVFAVVARRRYPKTEVPLGDLFTREGPPRLVLITCGGDFDRVTGHYADNVVVYALPVP